MYNTQIHTNTYKYIQVHTSTYKYIQIHTYTHTYIHAYTHIHTHTHTYIHAYIHAIPAYIVHTYIRTYKHTYTYISVYAYTPVCEFQPASQTSSRAPQCQGATLAAPMDLKDFVALFTLLKGLGQILGDRHQPGFES